MPILFKPGIKFPIILKGDAADAKPPKFIARAISCGTAMDFQEHVTAMKAASDAKDPVASLRALAALCDALESAIVGWEDLFDENGEPVPFDAKRLRHILDMKEVGELATAVLGGKLADDDIKKSASPSGLSSVSAVPDALNINV